MSFTPNMPLAGQSLGQTVTLIRDNFTNYNTVVSVNHVAPNDSSGNQGKHKFVQMPRQVSAPATAVNEIATYVKGTGASTRLWMRQQNNGTEVQLSGRDPTSATEGETFLPGGLLMKWGTATNIPGGSSFTNVTYATGPFPTATLNVIVTVRTTSTSTQAGVLVNSDPLQLTAAKFQARCTNTTGARDIFYIAIGN